MKQKTYYCPQGTISYWVSDLSEERKTLVFLPGLTADHRLFDKQVAYFESRYNMLVWDAPGHGASRPFTLAFSLEDKARWLHEILCTEGIEHPVLVGQSMGGYVAQMYMQLYPHSVEAFVSIDSAPLQRQYLSGFEIWCLKHVEKMYRWYPWEPLKSAAARGCAVSEYGRQLMLTMLSDYTHSEYASLAAHGYRILAEAIERNLPYEVDCPALLICGERDIAGSAKRYNTEWTKRTGIPLIWVPNAGHNSNTDQPELINTMIENITVSNKITNKYIMENIEKLTAWEKMQRDMIYDDFDEDLFWRRVDAKNIFNKFNQTTDDQPEERKELLKQLFGSIGENVYVEPTFKCEFGKNIYIGNDVYINFGAVLLDCSRITIGNHVLIGPNVGMYSANHSLDPEERAQGALIGGRITIGDKAWIAGDVKIMAGVTIGEGAVIGCGSVVTHDVPPRVLAAGNPCRVIREITDADKVGFVKGM